MCSSSRPYGQINKTSGPTYILSRPNCKLTHGLIYRHNGHICNWTNLFTDPMDILANPMDPFAKPMELLIDLMYIHRPIVIKLST
jgi:hypothetical protein